MLQWLLAIVVALTIGGAVAWLARGPLRRRDETAAGIAALSALSWREFIRVVLEALSRRGYHRLVNHESDAGDSDYTLVRDGEHWLLSVKHGGAFVLGRSAVDGLTAAMGVAGAAGGLLVTQGRIDDAARKAVRGRPVELLDGATLWPELRPLLPEGSVEPIREAAKHRARERALAGGLLALLAGLGVFALVPSPRPSTAIAGTTGAVAAPAPGQAASDATAPVADPDPATLQAQRLELASSVATLPDVSRALWTSASTLQVFVLGTDTDPFAAICPLVERYPALASSRIQLTPPADSGRQVRFRQCRSY